MYVGATSHTNSKFNLLRNSKLFSLRMDQRNRPRQSSISLRPHCLLFFSFVFGCDNSHPNGCEVAACCSLTMAKYAQRDICHLQHLKMRSTAALAESEIYWRNIIYTPDCSNPCYKAKHSTDSTLAPTRLPLSGLSPSGVVQARDHVSPSGPVFGQTCPGLPHLNLHSCLLSTPSNN